MPIRWHTDDRDLLIQVIELTARETGFTPRLVEKDYLCSVVAEKLRAASREESWPFSEHALAIGLALADSASGSTFPDGSRRFRISAAWLGVFATLLAKGFKRDDWCVALIFYAAPVGRGRTIERLSEKRLVRAVLEPATPRRVLREWGANRQELR